MPPPASDLRRGLARSESTMCWLILVFCPFFWLAVVVDCRRIADTLGGTILGWGISLGVFLCVRKWIERETGAKTFSRSRLGRRMVVLRVRYDIWREGRTPTDFERRAWAAYLRAGDPLADEGANEAPGKISDLPS